MTTARGLRNRNPGNIRYVAGGTSTYIGCVGKDDAGFCIFDTPENGIRAAAALLLAYYRYRDIKTIRAAINRWAPPSENDTGAYVNAVAAATGYAPDTPLDFTDPGTLAGLVTAIIRHENGSQPYTPEQIAGGIGGALGIRPQDVQTAAPATIPHADVPTPQPAPGVPKMDPLSLLALLGAFIPQVMTLIKPESKTMARDAALAQTVLNTAAQAAGVIQAGQTATATHVGQTVDALTANPALITAVQRAVVTEPTVMEALTLTEVGGGVVAARQADTVAMTAAVPFYKSSPVFWVSVMLLPLAAWYVGSSIVGGVEIPEEWPWYAQFLLKLFGVGWSADARAGMGNLVIGLILGGICGVYFGVSVTQSATNNQRRATDAVKTA